jgi:hypothetical protein
MVRFGAGIGMKSRCLVRTGGTMLGLEEKDLSETAKAFKVNAGIVSKIVRENSDFLVGIGEMLCSANHTMARRGKAALAPLALGFLAKGINPGLSHTSFPVALLSWIRFLPF